MTLTQTITTAEGAAGDLIYQQLSAIAYRTETVARYTAGTFDCSFVAHVHDEATGADAMVFTRKAEVIVAFRGTQRDYRDILTDLKFRRRQMMRRPEDPPVTIHRGFADQFLSIEFALRKAVEEQLETGHRLVVTGHSLGGALAIMACLHWQYIDRCVTFGAPRAGDDVIADILNANSVERTRYVYGTDIVPIVPLIAMGYRHDLRADYLTRDGTLIQNCPLWREILGRLRGLFSTDWSEKWGVVPVPKRLFTDHRIGAYGAALAKVSQT